MSIPQYQEFMNPVLQAFADGQPKQPSEAETFIVPILKLSQEDLSTLLPSGAQTIVRNRVQWALYYMYRAGLLEREKRGSYKISLLGKEALNKNIKINNDYLSQFEGFRKFQEKSGPTKTRQKSDKQELDPSEKITTAIEEINLKVQYDLLDQLKAVDPVYFERIILDLMVKMGYGGSRAEAAEMTKRSHDGGIDGIIKEDILGLDKIYLQAKRYAEGKVNSKEMRYFLGALSENNSNKGVFITTSEFDSKAIEMANKSNIILIDGQKLTSLMLQYNVGVLTKETIEIKELNLSYFSED